MLEDIYKTVDSMNAKMAAIKKEMREKTQPILNNAIQTVLKEVPEIEKVFWVQFTPYFNDGDTCYFSVHEPAIILRGDENYDDYEGSILYSEENLERAREDLEDVIEYNKDQEAWKDKFIEEIREKYGVAVARGYANRRQWLSPTYKNVEGAKLEIAYIENYFNKYGDRVSVIEEARSQLTTLITSIDESVMESIYGDHVRVTVSLEGTEIEEYSHD